MNRHYLWFGREEKYSLEERLDKTGGIIERMAEYPGGKGVGDLVHVKDAQKQFLGYGLGELKS